MLFSEPKIPQYVTFSTRASGKNVSVLFSEPKIPQLNDGASHNERDRSFQCSSASRKFLNQNRPSPPQTVRHRFSALQRAENSSMQNAEDYVQTVAVVSVLFSEPKIPQSVLRYRVRFHRRRFSALQRAENSSMHLCGVGFRQR